MNTLTNFNNLEEVATEFRKYLSGDHRREKDLILLFAHNGTGKTRLSMEFKKVGKREGGRDTLYFNAFTEDLFSWDNDLDNDADRKLKFNKSSTFFEGLQDLDMENRIGPIFQRYVPLNFFLDYEKNTVRFNRSIIVNGQEEIIENIKVSRGEENLFIWCFFLAICELVIDEDLAYSWVKYIYIDDPISSLDENNAIALACDLAKLIRKDEDQVKTIISTHHSLFFNIMYNELKKKRKCYFLAKNGTNGYTLRETNDTPFFHHVALLSQLKVVRDSETIYTFHFNALRSILEKTSSFFGYNDIKQCIHGLEDEVLFHRAVQLLSHGKYSIFAPKTMEDDTKDLFRRILDGFLDKYDFYLPEILTEESVEPQIT